MLKSVTTDKSKILNIAFNMGNCSFTTNFLFSCYDYGMIKKTNHVLATLCINLLYAHFQRTK